MIALIRRSWKMADSVRMLLIISGLLSVMLLGILLAPSSAYATSIALDPSSGRTGAQITITGDGFIGKNGDNLLG